MAARLDILNYAMDLDTVNRYCTQEVVTDSLVNSHI